MGWIVRLKEDAEIYKPRECLDYGDPDNFSIKLYHGGELKNDPKCYEGGSVDYIDGCNVDEIGIIEIHNMMKEVGDFGGFHKYWFRLPGTDMERGCFDLETDEDVVVMTNLLPPCKYFEVFAVVIRPLETSQSDSPFSQPEPHFRDFEFMQSTQEELMMEEELRELFNVEKDYSDREAYDYEEGGFETDDTSDESFHSDHSNKDESDDDLLFDMNVDDLDRGCRRFDGEMGGDLSDIDEESVYADSDEERMVANSTDEDEEGYPVFNDNANVSPVFELGMCFKSSKNFRDAVKRHAIMERRPIENTRIFGIKVQYVCKPPCKWKIYASPLQKSSTYQIKTFYPEHTCMPTFIQKQINALESVVPHAEHRFCVMHLFQNMHKEHKGIALRHLLWKAARSSTLWEFNFHMNLMKEVSPKCYDWLMQKPREQWSRSAFRTTPCSDMFVNNHCEVFNSSTRKYRDLPILTMFRQIHIAVMKRIQLRRDKMKDMPILICPSAQKKLNKAIQYAGNCVVNWSGGSTYSVTTSDGGHELVVDLHNRMCTCRKWDLTGIPCYHACSCIALRNESWENYISDWYKKENYLKLYSHTLEPIIGPEFWEDTNEPMPLPPNDKTPTGRPKKKRNAKNDISRDLTKLKRKNTVVHCTYCKAAGHNWRSCQARKSDDVKKAQAEGKTLEVTKIKVTCKTCNKQGHNSRTCIVKKSLPNWARESTNEGGAQGVQDKGKILVSELESVFNNGKKGNGENVARMKKGAAAQKLQTKKK